MFSAMSVYEDPWREMDMMTDLTGQQFGNYRLVRCLGVGGFASVYLGQHVRISSKQAAIKILELRDVNMQEFQPSPRQRWQEGWSTLALMMASCIPLIRLVVRL